LVYLDETGSTGTDLTDSQQPVFVLAALIVPEACWQALEADLEGAISKHLPELSKAGHEVHAADLRAGRRAFKGVPVDTRIALRDDWLQIAQSHNLKLVYRAIVKRRFQTWMQATFGTGVLINPHVAAFALVARVVDEYLASLPGPTLGMFISDENQQIVRDVEKSIKVLRGVEGSLRLTRIVEKGFFIDSRKSRPLQLCDLCALHARKKEEDKAGKPAKSVDTIGIQRIEPLIHRGNESLQDVLAWLARQQSATEQKK
jgi:hypothetical protein